MTSNEFKPGDLVFEVKGDRITAGKLTKRGENTVRLEGGNTTYIPSGYALGNLYMGKLFHATSENHQALITLYGEDAVPDIPLRGSELTKKLLKHQKYVLCRVSNSSESLAREWPQEICVVSAFMDKGFATGNGRYSNYAVPIDNHGHEITEIES